MKLCEVMGQMSKLAPTSFKILEQFRDPADYNELMSVLLGSGSPNVSHLKPVAKNILQRRNWIWVLTHPELGEDHIHPDRSVFPHPAVVCAWNGTGICLIAGRVSLLRKSFPPLMAVCSHVHRGAVGGVGTGGSAGEA